MQATDTRHTDMKRKELDISREGLAELLQVVIDKGRSFRFQARGYSMSPFIRDGDVVTLSPYLRDHPRVGHVVATLHPQYSKLIIHRIVSISGGRVLLCGDNRQLWDGFVDKGTIIARVTGIDRNGRSVRFGLGAERLVLAYLSRRHQLIGLLTQIRRLLGRG